MPRPSNCAFWAGVPTRDPQGILQARVTPGVAHQDVRGTGALLTLWPDR